MKLILNRITSQGVCPRELWSPAEPRGVPSPAPLPPRGIFYSSQAFRSELTDRLAAYENTGLTSGQVKGLAEFRRKRMMVIVKGNHLIKIPFRK